MKLIGSLENRIILLKGTTRKISSQEGGYLNFLKPLISVGLPLMKNILTPLAKSVFVPLGLRPAASATNAAVQKKIFGSDTTTLAFSNEGLHDIMKIIKSFEESGLFMNGVSEIVKTEVKKQKGGFLRMSAATFGASLLGIILTGKRLVKNGDGVIPADEGDIRAGEEQDF